MKRKLEETARLIQSQKEQKKREAKNRTQSDVRYLEFYAKLFMPNFLCQSLNVENFLRFIKAKKKS